MANFQVRPVGAGSPYELPESWMTSLLAPGWPIQPIAMPEEKIPREIEYPPGVNLTIVPRVGFGHKPFSAIREVYNNVSEVSQLVRLLQKEMSVFQPTLWEGDKPVEPEEDWSWLVLRPDGENVWTVWLAKFLENLLVYDAPAVYFEKDGTGKLRALRIIDGSTLLRLIDDRGRVPRPPAPAFVQIIHGVPTAWFTVEEIWYRPRNPRLNSPYGISPIEDSWDWIMLIAAIKGYELSFYKEGNMPEGIAEAPPGLTWSQLAEIEDLWNRSMQTTLGARRRWRFVPNGFKFTPLKTLPFPIDLYREAVVRLGMAFGVPASELGVQPGGALARGLVETMRGQLYRSAISPLKSFVEQFFNEVLQRFNLPFEFSLEFPVDTDDPDKKMKNVLDLFSFGIITLNDALRELGYEPIPGGDARFVTRGGYIVRLDDFLGGKMPGAEPDGPEAAPDAPDAPEPPDNPDDVKPQRVARQLAMFRQVADRMRLVRRQQRGARRGVVIRKHCGVCEEDDVWYGAETIEETEMLFPSPHHANEVRIVAIRRNGERRTALFKPESGEKQSLRDWVGGPLAPREEATYLLDRMLGFYLVPVAYVAEVDGERGAVIYYTPRAEARKAASQYAPEWIERAAVLDYIAGQLDREGHNWFTHPEDGNRPVLYDNGLCFPTKDLRVGSSFAKAWAGRPLSGEVIRAIEACLRDPGWEDIQDLVGPDAAERARQRAAQLLREQRIPSEAVR